MITLQPWTPAVLDPMSNRWRLMYGGKVGWARKRVVEFITDECQPLFPNIQYKAVPLPTNGANNG